ncbi:E3 ubiquitin-protein ligase lubel isoform X3 [Drosophila willistoni]|uniref:E3 ubiquitin-protein ligase lubel isoform X3 n=1 Tax=Drosophila willistoni TaxID=7260 RepID=UPI001F08675D|nr:E3 ubiquitin-protein ligase lubel isoform X3 [Drosophila willistoni]
MTTQQLLNKNVRTMPSWVTEASQRIGPKPPPLPPNAQNGSNGTILPKAPALPPKSKDTPEPDYEVIEFSNQQQYSNEPMKTTIVRTKTPDNKLKCTLCGSQNPWVTCEECAGQIFCASCDDMFHKHPKRKQHIRKAVQQATPPIPPKVQGGPTPPVAPPRRSKRGLLTPFLGRKDQMLPPPSPTPSHRSTSAWRGGVQPPLPPHSSSSTMNNRPLPDPPRTPMSEGGGSSRSETPKSVFDTIQRPPSVQLEKIKTKASATLDRMAILQQRYRQQKAQQDLRASEQAAGNQRRQMSTSVFNLNTTNRRPLQETPQNGANSAAWLANQRMQQAQSMAQLNCAGCQHQQQNRQMQHPDDWSQFGSQQQFNHSNLSLNVGPGYLNQQHPSHYPHPPPVFMTQRGMMPNMYPGPGYPLMHPGVMGMPPPRASSRPRYAASPTPSRKSLSMRRKRSSYVDDELTDDEDSDQDDRRSLVSNRSGMTSASRSHHHHHQQQPPHHHQQRQRRLSSASQLINHNDDIDGNRHHQPKVRERRGSIAKSVQSEWLPERRDSTDELGEGNETLKRSQVDPPKTSRIYSDLESEGSGARALVQAKIQQKLQEADQHKAKKASQHKHKPEMKDENTQAAAVVQKVAPHAAAKEESASEYEEIVEEVTATESEPEQAQPSQPDNIEADAEADELGPPPSTPDHEWECEFCTFVNEPNIKICSICCKTPSKPPQPTKNAVKTESKPVPHVEIPKPKEIVNQKQQPQTNVVRKPSIKSSQKPTEKIASPAKTKSSATTSTATASTSTAKKLSSPPKPTLKTSSENESDNSLAKGFLHKESVENIWNTLDESIQAQAEQVLKKAQKVSTSCGGTPPREIPVEKPIVDTSREMGTSPPPQSISTQTYEALPLSPQVESPTVSNATVVRESPGKMERRPHYRSNSQLPQEHERYRSANDLRYANEGFGMDYYGNSGQVTRRPNFINDLRLLQHQTSSPFDMPVEPSFNLKHEPARDPETEMHIILKELELYKFTVEELEAALKYCAPDTHPIQWLRENWHKLIQTVQSLSTKYGQERGENTIGSISQNEAREALRCSSGNVWQAVADCIQQRQQKYRRLAAKGNFLRDDIVNALTAHQGNVEQALLELNRTQLKPFLMRIWGSPNGVENESVPAIDMKSDIHDFLNTHALDCLQMPHGAGESPSPGPAFANHPFDDNSSPSKSSYATPSPYQLEDSTLKNLEILIGNMEQNQAKQNQEVLRSIETMLETFKGKPDQDYETDPEVMRILTKSPISASRISAVIDDKSTEDVKNFVWQHIQDIVPNLVQQVEQELKEPSPLKEPEPQPEPEVISTPAVDPEVYIMEEVIKPNLKEANIKEEVPINFIYATEIANFKLEFDRGNEKWHESEWEPFDLKHAERVVYKSFTAPKAKIVEAVKESISQETIPQNEHPISAESDQQIIQNQETTDPLIKSTNVEREQETINLDKVAEEKIKLTKSENSANNEVTNKIIPTTTETASSSEILTSKVLPTTTEKATSSETLGQTTKTDIKKDIEKITAESESKLESTVKNTNEVAETTTKEIKQILPTEPVERIAQETTEQPPVEVLDEKPSTSREAVRRNKRSQLPKKGRTRDHSQKPTNRVKLPKEVETAIDTKDSTSVATLNNDNNLAEPAVSASKVVAEPSSNPIEDISKEQVIESKIDELAHEPVAVEVDTSDEQSKFNIQLTLETAEAEKSKIQIVEKTESITEPLKTVENEAIIEQSSNNLGSSTNLLEQPEILGTNDEPIVEETTNNSTNNISVEQTETPRNDEQFVVETTNNKALNSTSLEQREPFENDEPMGVEPSNDEAFNNSSVEQTETLENDEQFIVEATNNNALNTSSLEQTGTLENDEQIEIIEELNAPVDAKESNTIVPEASKEEVTNAIEPATNKITAENKRSPKRFSKIPVRTLSTNSLRSESRTENLVSTEADELESDGVTKTEEEPSSTTTETDVVISPVESEEIFEDAAEFSGEDAELYSLDSDEQRIEVVQSQSPLPAEDSALESIIPKSTSSASVDSHSSQSESPKVVQLKEFIPSGDPSKQNLSELVEDTQRLIKQMRDEISMDDFESTDEDEYSDEYSDDMEWYDSEGEEEEEEEGEMDEDERTSYIEDASTGDEAEGTEIEDIIEEDEENEEEHTATQNPETVMTSSSVTLANQPIASDTNATNEIISLTGSEANESTETAVIPDVGVIQAETHSVVADVPESSTEAIAVEDVMDVETEDPVEVPTPLPLTPAPPIIDSESRPMELPVETVLEEPKKVKASSPTKTSSKQKTLTTEPVASTSTQSPSTITPKTGKSSISKIPKPTTNETPNTTNRKLPLRSKSFSAPMGISSVKRMQQEYLQKQQSIKSTAVPVALSSRVPLRSSPAAKKSITEAISRFNTQSQQDGPSTSGAAAAAALLKPRSQPRIPKKKYHETCFSDDDYETSATEEEDHEDAAEPLRAELLKRKLSMPVFRAYASLQEPVIEEPAVLARKYVEMEKVSNLAEAQIAATLVNMKFQEDVALWAAKECSDLDQAIAMLQQDCELCMNTYPMNQIVSMLKCTHKCCKQCAKTYFTVQITDRSINDCNCPFCKLPELSNEVEHEDEHLEYFSNLDIFLKSILDNDVHELFQRKLRDRSLLQDPNFKWCIQCSSGFFARPKQKRLICPDCGSVTCAQCRKPWERQHEGSTCEAYLEWHRENDPELQAQGVQEHLAQNGIDCPKCKFRYSLARGGCMHFTCTQCKFEFCYGCARPFMMGAKCNISPYCAKLGLHAHHPRNCLFYLRDKIPLQLQFLLKEQKVKFDTEAKEDVKNEPSSSRKARASAKCPIPLQKETPQGLVDTVCNSEVPDKHAGMCRTHYVEYLAGKVAKAGIDPLPIFDLTDCVQELRRRGIALPERGPWDTDEIYKNMCSEVIKQHIPLKSA